MHASRGFFRAAVLLGVGLGGLIDGILLHQVLQWHHLLSRPIPPISVESLELNTLADGLFHLAAWVITLAGVVWLSRTRRPEVGAGGKFAGGLLLGCGGFNVVEGVVDHYLLGIHHVRAGPDAWLYDLVALILAIVLVVAGITVTKRASAAPPGRDRRPFGRGS